MSEWGPWIEHDGNGCPCVGMYVQIDVARVGIDEVIAGAECISHGIDPSGTASAWVWHEYPTYGDVFRYRIRKPRGMTILRQIVENPPKELIDA